MFNQAEGVKLPKFVVQLSSAAVLYGFYIEKSDEAMDSGWRWHAFLELLSDVKWQERLVPVSYTHLVPTDARRYVTLRKVRRTSSS